MARVNFNANEIDQNFQIEEAIESAINVDGSASIAAAVIESSYDLPNDSGEIIEATLEQKCGAIENRLGLQFSLGGETVIFRKPHPR
jgi:hypothetical protein